ncbi:tripeptidyl peptidase A [Mycena floridula]|nr:tripeptidyl peptidase A [Mycena floridula]
MKLLSAAVVLAVIPALSFASLKVKDSVIPHGWVKHSVPRPESLITLKIALGQPNFPVLEKHLMEISDPSHSRYGQFLTKEEVDEVVAPNEEAHALVDAWLVSYRVPVDRAPAKDWVSLTVPIRLAEKMLDTKYFVWKHLETGDNITRTTSYSLPEQLHEHVDLIQPTTMFSRWQSMRSTVFFEEAQVNSKEIAVETSYQSPGLTPVDPKCNLTITISCLKQLYGAVDYKVKSAHKNSIGISSFLEQNVNRADLQTFYKEQVPAAVNSSFEFISVNGGLNDQDPSLAGIEANLDSQFAFGLSYPTPATAYSTAGRPPFLPTEPGQENTNEPYLDWLHYVLGHDKRPHVISTSYGESEQTVPEDYARRVCQEFAKLGALGVSLVVSSGDAGVGDGSKACLTNDGTNHTRFQALFPAACPYVTAVGATVNTPQETAVFFSGGGFSDRYPRPCYQDDAVKDFLKTLPKGLYKGLFNSSGRAIPDVAAQGRRFRVYASGKPISVSGTSASAPTFAAIIALVNDARLTNNQSTLGFLNPLLYQPRVAATFNDITTGSNPGCGTPGFNATKHWDPVTGLGTPNLKKLLEALKL